MIAGCVGSSCALSGMGFYAAQRFTTFNDPNTRFVSDSDSIPGGLA